MARLRLRSEQQQAFRDLFEMAATMRLQDFREKVYAQAETRREAQEDILKRTFQEEGEATELPTAEQQGIIDEEIQRAAEGEREALQRRSANRQGITDFFGMVRNVLKSPPELRSVGVEAMNRKVQELTGKPIDREVVKILSTPDTGVVGSLLEEAAKGALLLDHPVHQIAGAFTDPVRFAETANALAGDARRRMSMGPELASVQDQLQLLSVGRQKLQNRLMAFEQRMQRAGAAGASLSTMEVLQKEADRMTTALGQADARINALVERQGTLEGRQETRIGKREELGFQALTKRAELGLEHEYRQEEEILKGQIQERLKGRGQRIRVTPDWEVLVEEGYLGPTIEATPAQQSKMQDELMNLRSSLAQTRKIADAYKADYLRFSTRFSAITKSLGLKAGMKLSEEDRKAHREIVRFIASSARQLSDIIKERAGSAFTKQESVRILNWVPNAGTINATLEDLLNFTDFDDEIAFEEKNRVLMEMMQAAEVRLEYALTHGFRITGKENDPELNRLEREMPLPENDPSAFKYDDVTKKHYIRFGQKWIPVNP